MIIHELATNACKYGALSRATGLVEVRWTALKEGGAQLDWRETGGPVVQPPTDAGFGSRLVQQLVRQLSGEALFDWGPSGLAVRLTLGPPTEDPEAAEV